MLLAVGLAGGGVAVAVASVPDSSGVIHGCYSVDGSGNPVTGATLTVIDPSAGQHCNTAGPAGAAPPQRELSWNQQGAQGPPGQQGSQGPPGPTATITKGGTLTLSGGQVLQVESAGGGITLPTPSRNLPRGSDMVMGGGPSFSILSVSLLGNHGAGGGTGAARSGPTVKDISITKTVDKSSPVLFQACASGKHFPKVTITLRKKSGGKAYLRYTLSNVFVTSIQSAGAPSDKLPTEQVSFSYGSIQIQYAPQ